MFQNFKRVDGQYAGSKLPDPQGALAHIGDCLPLLHKEVPRGSMHPKRVGKHDIHGPSLERRK